MDEPWVELELEELDEVEDYEGEVYPPVSVRRRGVAFTGAVLDHREPGVTRLEYCEGRLQGICRTLDAEGRLRWKAHYGEGRPYGKACRWDGEGTLRSREFYDEPGRQILTQSFDAQGRLRHERTPTRERTWYAEGGLRSDRAAEDRIRWVYVKDGRRAFGEGVQSLDQANVYDHFEFVDAVLADAIVELLGEFEFDRGVWMWLHRRLDAGEGEAIVDLRRALAHDELGVRVTALNLIGNRGLRELAPEVRAMLDDARVPVLRFGEYPGQGGRGHSFPIGETARIALAKLGE